MKQLHTQVLIIGGGVTGTGIARDLALRGVDCLLVETRDINAGASGANHGLLHSGARYVSSDPHAARECCEENMLLKQTAPHCIEATGGLFVAVAGDDEHYIAEFPNLCRQFGIPVESLSVQEARDMEPLLSDQTIAAYAVPDASVDPFKLSLANLGDAMDHGARVRLQTGVTGFRIDDGKIVQTRLLDRKTGDEILVTAVQVINAAGAWAGEVAALAGQTLHLLYSKGSLLITDVRITDRVINRLHQSSDADILVPGGTVSILGTTSIRIRDLREIRPTIQEIDYIIDTAAGMIPQLQKQRYIRAYAGVRPLVGTGDTARDDRSVTRGYALIDHEQSGLDNLTSMIGGKLTTYRAMAEKTVDLVCRKLGIGAT
jgi:glycerol-3-phosphate dehydrogenase